jgi:nucleoside-diphosphate-sugar epimerase
LKLFEAHLLERDSFLTAMQRCSTVFHVASPFLVPEKIRDPEEQLFRPAVEGTQNILESVDKTESVQRVILTSSSTCPTIRY